MHEKPDWPHVGRDDPEWHDRDGRAIAAAAMLIAGALLGGIVVLLAKL